MGDPINPIVVDKSKIYKQLPKLHKAKDLIRAQTPDNEVLSEDSGAEQYKKTPSEKKRRGKKTLTVDPNLPADSDKTKKAPQSARNPIVKMNSNLRDLVSPDQDESPINKMSPSPRNEENSNNSPSPLKYNETIREDRSESTFKGDETIQFGKNTVEGAQNLLK